MIPVSFQNVLLLFSRCRGKLRSARFKFLFPALLAAVTVAFHLPGQDGWTEKQLTDLSLREKIAQLVLIRVPGRFINRRDPQYLAIRNHIRLNDIGGVVLFAGNVYESAVLLNELQTLSRLPLLVAADFENGVSFRIADTTSFPWAMALGATGSELYAYRQGAVTARESRALGVHWIFAPVVDINNNPDNPVINIRSFGEQPDLVGRLSAAFIRGAKNSGVLTTAKHFPGHGDTAVDSHLGLPVVQSDMNRLQSVEFESFKSAIRAGVDSIMTAHMAVPKVTGDKQLPSTLSEKMLTDILCDSLKFDGIVVTDALEMAGITNHYWCGLAAVRAIKAGADVLLLPPDAAVAVDEVERAVRRGDISETRIDRSLRKILSAKSRLGLHRNRLVPIDRIAEIIASPQNTELAQEIADHSITAVKDATHLLPLNPLSGARVFSLVLSAGLDYSPGAVFQAEMRKRFPDIRTAWADERIPEDLSSSIGRYAAESDLIVLSVMARLGSYGRHFSIPKSQRLILQRLTAAHKPLICVIFGNPYALRLFPDIGTCLLTFSYSDVSQTAAAKALSGAIEISGRMPVSIPRYVRAGRGLQVPKIEMQLRRISGESARRWDRAFRDSKRLLESYIASGTFSGAHLAAGLENRILLDFYEGATAHSADSARVSFDTLYSAPSLSRIMAVSSAAMLALDSGGLLPDFPISDFVAEWKENDYFAVGDLWQSFSNAALPEAEIHRNEDLLKDIISRVSGTSWEGFLKQKLLDPLRLHSTRFIAPGDFCGSLAYSGEWKEPSFFTNARDMAVFAQLMLNRGAYDHRRFLHPQTIESFTLWRGVWEKPAASEWSGESLSPSAFGHYAPTGSFLWIDPEKQLFVVLLANGSPEDPRIPQAQRKLAQSVVSAMLRSLSEN